MVASTALVRFRRLRLGAAAMAAAAVLAAVALVVAALGSGSTAIAVAAIGALAGGAFMAFTRQVRRPLIALLFFVAPLDISKAVLVPLASIFYESGPYYSPGLYLTLANAVLLALTAAWIFKAAVLKRQGLPWTRLDALATVYLGWIWLRSFGAAQGALSLASAASYSFCVLCFYVVSHNLNRRNDLRLALGSSALALVLQLLYVGAQMLTHSALTLPGSKGLGTAGMLAIDGEQTMRPAGSFSHPNALAHYLVILLPPLIALALLGPKRLPVRVWGTCIALLAGGIAALLATLSRGGWAALGLAIIVLVFVYRRHGLIQSRHIVRGLGAVALGCVLIVTVDPNVLLRLTGPDDRSLESRVLLADVAIKIIKTNPVMGVGFGDYNRIAFGYTAPSWAFVSEEYHFLLHQLVVHNHFLLFAAELGIPAMLLFAYLLWRFIRLPWPLERWTDPGRFALAIGLSASLAGQAFFLNSDNYYTDIRIFLLWMSAGVLQAMTLQTSVVAAKNPRRGGSA